MANKPEASAAPPAGKKKKPKLLIAIVAVVLVLGGGGAAFFLLGGKTGKDGEHAQEAPDEHAKPPVFVTLDPFTVNLTSETAERFLQVGIDLKVSGPEVADKVKVHLPEIKNGILLLLTSKRAEDLSGVEGKNRLREEIRDIVNQASGYYRPPPAPKPSIDKSGVAAEDKPGEPKSAQDKPAQEMPADDKHAEGKPAGEAPVDKAADRVPKIGVIDVLLTSFVIQ
jgi:flagellar FliL protein